jgi:protein tyrosine phosphatase (PTP) superfamily phosphohydrolase (DUF442 family)
MLKSSIQHHSRYRLLLLILCFSAAQAADTLRPFTTDGCSLFPDGTANNKNLWRQCCIEHDRAYWLGGTYAERRAADTELKQCVTGLDEKLIAELMRTGVRVGGSPWWPTPFRWGYGWPYGRGYQAVTEEEERLALSLMATPAPADPSRPERWAQPIVMAGAPNLHQVSKTLYRSAQPSAEGMRNLEQHGIKTVLNLRAFHSDRDELAGTRLAGEHLFMKTWHPEREDVVKFLKLATDPARVPLLVHCQHGADRTGTMVAIYRVAVQGWSMDDAVREMTRGGFGFHEAWVNLVPWLYRLDIDSLRREAGFPVSRAAGN